MELVKIEASEYGLDESKETELMGNLPQLKSERDELEKQFDEVIKMDIKSPETWSRARELRLLIQKNRTLGINVWHKTTKDFFLKGGQFVDAIKKMEIAVNERMESQLDEIEKYEQILDQIRVEKLQVKRAVELQKYEPEEIPENLGNMPDEIWDNYITGNKVNYENKKAAEKKAEEDRIAKEKADAEERKQIQLDNARLQKEAEEREKQAKKEDDERQKAEAERVRKEEIERKKQEEEKKQAAIEFDKKLRLEQKEKQRIQDELQSRKDAEEKAEAERVELEQSELNKGDSDKVNDLITDLEELKLKYQFKSAKNQKMYSDVGLLIDKVVNHIIN